jgi:hypothetical protein
MRSLHPSMALSIAQSTKMALASRKVVAGCGSRQQNEQEWPFKVFKDLRYLAGPSSLPSFGLALLTTPPIPISLSGGSLLALNQLDSKHTSRNTAQSTTLSFNTLVAATTRAGRWPTLIATKTLSKLLLGSKTKSSKGRSFIPRKRLQKASLSKDWTSWRDIPPGEPATHPLSCHHTASADSVWSAIGNRSA